MYLPKPPFFLGVAMVKMKNNASKGTAMSSEFSQEFPTVLYSNSTYSTHSSTYRRIPRRAGTTQHSQLRKQNNYISSSPNNGFFPFILHGANLACQWSNVVHEKKHISLHAQFVSMFSRGCCMASSKLARAM